MATEAEEKQVSLGSWKPRRGYIKEKMLLMGSVWVPVILFILSRQWSGVDWGHSHASCSGSPTVRKDTG